tara:strand:+ start:3443 stop:3916 length:474 start_codon:yes stop_codon:yes gene_type:complete
MKKVSEILRSLKKYCENPNFQLIGLLLFVIGISFTIHRNSEQVKELENANAKLAFTNIELKHENKEWKDETNAANSEIMETYPRIRGYELALSNLVTSYEELLTLNIFLKTIPNTQIYLLYIYEGEMFEIKFPSKNIKKDHLKSIKDNFQFTTIIFN